MRLRLLPCVPSIGHPHHRLFMLRSRGRRHWTTCLVSESRPDRALRVVWLMTIWGEPRPEGLMFWQGEIGLDVTSSTLCFGVILRSRPLRVKGVQPNGAGRGRCIVRATETK